jgi:hypothetical protein
VINKIAMIAAIHIEKLEVRFAMIILLDYEIIL